MFRRPPPEANGSRNQLSSFIIVICISTIIIKLYHYYDYHYYPTAKRPAQHPSANPGEAMAARPALLQSWESVPARMCECSMQHTYWEKDKDEEAYRGLQGVIRGWRGAKSDWKYTWMCMHVCVHVARVCKSINVCSESFTRCLCSLRVTCTPMRCHVMHTHIPIAIPWRVRLRKHVHVLCFRVRDVPMCTHTCTSMTLSHISTY